MAIFPYDVKTGRALYEKARWGACGLGKAPSPVAPLTLSETIRWARRVPRSARVAQGFPRIIDFARKVKRLRTERAEVRRRHPNPLRRAILDKLDRVLTDRSDLVIAARREAHFWWKPRVTDASSVSPTPSVGRSCWGLAAMAARCGKHRPASSIG
jgi:hypothetical protein